MRKGRCRVRSIDPRVWKILERLSWEERNVDKFDDAFEASQQEGVEEFGMVFVKAQEHAMAAGYGGIFEPFPLSRPRSRVEAARLSSIVLAVLKAVRTLKDREKTGQKTPVINGERYKASRRRPKSKHD